MSPLQNDTVAHDRPSSHTRCQDTPRLAAIAPIPCNHRSPHQVPKLALRSHSRQAGAGVSGFPTSVSYKKAPGASIRNLLLHKVSCTSRVTSSKLASITDSQNLSSSSPSAPLASSKLQSRYFRSRIKIHLKKLKKNMAHHCALHFSNLSQKEKQN